MSDPATIAELLEARQRARDGARDPTCRFCGGKKKLPSGLACVCAPLRDSDELGPAPKVPEPRDDVRERVAAEQGLRLRAPRKKSREDDAVEAELRTRADGKPAPEWYARITPFERKKIHDLYRAGMEYAAIAAELGRPMGTIKHEINRAQKAGKLKHRYKVGKDEDDA